MAITLTGDMSQTTHGCYALGEQVTATFACTGLTGNETLNISVTNEFDVEVYSGTVEVINSGGSWTSSAIDLPDATLGFYRVNVAIDGSGETLAALGSRYAGYLTYIVVPDPATRTNPDAEDAFFGMQCPTVNVDGAIQHIGVRHVLGGNGYWWDKYDYDSPGGAFAASYAAAVIAQTNFPPLLSGAEGLTYNGSNYTTYYFPTLMMCPSWAIEPGSGGSSGRTGILTDPDGEAAWVAYVEVATQAYVYNHPNATRRYYQITWEPDGATAFQGTQEQFVRIYELAYSVIHANDPNAFVVGPTVSGLISAASEQVSEDFLVGLTPYIDGVSVHAYLSPGSGVRTDAEKRVDILSLKSGILAEAGTAMPWLNTEQGWFSNNNTDELVKAQQDIRDALLTYGEGAILSMHFYLVDNVYVGDGYTYAGYFYNLQAGHNYDANKIGPKPGAAAFAAMSYLLEGSVSQGRLDGLVTGTHGYRHTRSDQTILTVWSQQTDTDLSIAVGSDAVCYDWMGNDMSIPVRAGRMTVTATTEPYYIQYTTLLKSPDLPAQHLRYAPSSGGTMGVPLRSSAAEVVPV